MKWEICEHSPWSIQITILRESKQEKGVSNIYPPSMIWLFLIYSIHPSLLQQFNPTWTPNSCPCLLWHHESINSTRNEWIIFSIFEAYCSNHWNRYAFPPLAETKYGLIPFFLKKLDCSVFRAVILTTILDHQRANNQICLMICSAF